MIDLKTQIAKLRDGGIVLYPTDTIWGIGCDATNDEACQRIADLKGRSDDKSFILLADGFPMIQKYILEFPEVCVQGNGPGAGRALSARRRRPSRRCPSWSRSTRRKRLVLPPR